MPTIDQLDPATAASDGDLLLVSQSGISRKITRSQILAGMQPQLAVSSGMLLGRNSPGAGSPEVVSIGANLILSNGTLSATAQQYVIGNLPQGTVPSSTDLVGISQSGTNTAVTYGQFLSGLSGVQNVDGSQLLLTPTAGTNSVKLADFAAATLPISGGSMTGSLTLAADPTTPLQAATKGYVDGRASTTLPLSGGILSGPLTLSADPVSATQAATKQYVDGQVATALPKSGGALSGALLLAGDPASSLQAATKQYVDTRVSRSGDTLSGPLTLAGDPVASLQAATKQYVDAQISTALPKSGGSLTGALLLNADPSVASQAATKQYVDNQFAAALPIVGGTLSGALTLGANPTSAMQAATKQYVDSQIGTTLPISGGKMTGALTLSANPTTALQAATKQYVDTSSGATGVINVKSPPYSAQLDGVTDDTAAFKAAYQAAAPGSVIYVPNGVTKLQSPGSWGISLTKWVKWVVDGTTLADGTPLSSAIPSGTGPASLTLPGVVTGNSGTSTEVSQGSSQASDFAVLHASYIVNHSGGTSGNVSAGTRNDTIIYNSPNNYIWGGLDRLIWAGTQTPSASAPAQHVARYVQAVRQTVGTDANGNALPQPQIWTACLEYRDVTGQPSSATNAALVVEMDWYGNGPDDASSRQIQSLVVGQNNLGGAPVEVSSIIGVYLAAGSSGHAGRVFNVGIPFSTAILDTTASQQLSGAAAIRLAAGHAIAFEPTNNYRLAFDGNTNTLRWYQGSLSYAVGKGITVGFQNVCSGNTSLANFLAGNIVFLVGASPYTITLPPASTVAAGTGFTFSVLGSGPATIAPSGTDAIDNGPVILRQNDRYHVISDGSGVWREVFRTNAVNPRFSGPPILPSYTVASLPTPGAAGAKAFATNGRKPGESAGAGSGVEVFFDGAHWICGCTGSQVLA